VKRKLRADEAVERLRRLPFEDISFAKIDHRRALRQGYPEVVFARGKTPKQVAEIVGGMLRANASYNILITRTNKDTLAITPYPLAQALFTHPRWSCVAASRG
jgi:pyridinium-3,5-biscarboxylic acid mononucleotide synthase